VRNRASHGADSLAGARAGHRWNACDSHDAPLRFSRFVRK
jgi:hypothetical protein